MIPILIIVGVIAILFFASAKGSAADVVVPDSSGGCMAEKLSYDEIFALAQNAGFGSDSGTAAAIALAESGGDPAIYGDIHLAPSNGPAVGLWQINTAKHKEFTPEELTDPQTNANEAFNVYSAAGGFSPWTTFKTGAYQEFLQ